MKMEQFVISSQMYKAWFLNFEMEITFHVTTLNQKLDIGKKMPPKTSIKKSVGTLAQKA